MDDIQFVDSKFVFGIIFPSGGNRGFNNRLLFLYCFLEIVVREQGCNGGAQSRDTGITPVPQLGKPWELGDPSYHDFVAMISGILLKGQ